MAIANNERIVVYGDFDDGVTSTCIMMTTPDIAWCECNSLYSIKVDEGYGVNNAALGLS